MSVHVYRKILSEDQVMGSCICVFNPAERKYMYILGRIGLYFVGLGEKLNYVMELPSKGNWRTRETENILQVFGENNELFLR